MIYNMTKAETSYRGNNRDSITGRSHNNNNNNNNKLPSAGSKLGTAPPKSCAGPPNF